MRLLNNIRSAGVFGFLFSARYLENANYPLHEYLRPISLWALFYFVFTLIMWLVYISSLANGKYKTYKLDSRRNSLSIFQLLLLVLAIIAFFYFGSIDKGDYIFLGLFAVVVFFNIWLAGKYSGQLNWNENEMFVFPYGPWGRLTRKWTMVKDDSTGQVQVQLRGWSQFFQGMNSLIKINRDDADRFLTDMGKRSDAGN